MRPLCHGYAETVGLLLSKKRPSERLAEAGRTFPLHVRLASEPLGLQPQLPRLARSCPGQLFASRPHLRLKPKSHDETMGRDPHALPPHPSRLGFPCSGFQQLCLRTPSVSRELKEQTGQWACKPATPTVFCHLPRLPTCSGPLTILPHLPHLPHLPRFPEARVAGSGQYQLALPGHQVGQVRSGEKQVGHVGGATSVNGCCGRSQ